MRNWIIIFFCFIIALILYNLMVRYDINLAVNRHIKYLDCDIKYKHKITNWKASSLIWAENIWEEDSAKYVFIKCLCEGYSTMKDSLSKVYIEEFFYSDSWSISNYIKLIPQRIDTSVMLNYFSEIFWRYPKYLDSITKYSPDTNVFKQILFDKFNEDFIIQMDYYNFLLAFPKYKPKIDTLIKYRNYIFKVPPRYGGS